MNSQKDKFKIPDEVSYLNTAYMSPLLKSVEQVGFEAVSKKCLPYEITGNDFFEPVEKLKTLFAKLIQTPNPESIAIIPSASYGLASAANNIKLNPSDEVLVVEDQFPSNIYTWKSLVDKFDAKLKIVNSPKTTIDRGRVWNQNILNAITSKTAVVAIPQVHWADGTLFDLKQIREKSNQHNALLIIDGTQSVGAMPFSIKEIQPDAVVCASYKWLLGSYSIGVAYYGERFNSGKPIEENWINRLNSEDFAGLVNYQDTYKEKANRYSVGEVSNFILVPMAIKALEQIIEWGTENIQGYCHNISENAITKLNELDCSVEQNKYRGNHLFGIKLGNHINAEILKQEFEKNKVYVSFRGNYVRIASHLFNTTQDFDKLVNCFEKALE
ncbi:MAG: aminotransferase class V-fold PLP-dependent enzyme [Ignavibacteriae bacterium]|nr:aminotransferase class V-fold PLP-dependent enzyme [Ignavibacteriota bacterium]